MAKNQPTNQLNQADSDLLSAYLDKQLSREAQQSLDQRLEREPHLRAELSDLRATVALLHELEPARPPRSFTLDPATVRAPQSLWQLPATWMRLGSAFAVLLLALTVTLNTSRGRSTSSAVPMTGAAMPAATSAPAAAAPAALAAQPPAPVAASGETTDSTANSAARTMVEPTADGSQPGALAQNSGISDPRTSSPDTTSLSSFQSESPQEVAPPARPLLWLQIGLGALALLLLAGSFLVARRR